MEKKQKSHAAAPAVQKSAEGWRGKICHFCEKFERIANAAAAPLPSPRIKLWLAGFFHPEETYEKVEKNATLAGLAWNLILFYIAYSAIFFLFMLALTSSLPPDEMLSFGLQKNPDIPSIAFGSLVISPLVSTFFAMFAFAVVFASARLLGGKGNYVRQANSMSLVLCGSNLLLLASMCVAFALFAPSFILRGSAFIGTIVSLLALLASVPLLMLFLAILLYTIYAYYLVVKKAHQLSAWKAAGAIANAAALVVLLEISLNAMLA